MHFLRSEPIPLLGYYFVFTVHAFQHTSEHFKSPDELNLIPDHKIKRWFFQFSKGEAEACSIQAIQFFRKAACLLSATSIAFTAFSETSVAQA